MNLAITSAALAEPESLYVTSTNGQTYGPFVYTNGATIGVVTPAAAQIADIETNIPSESQVILSPTNAATDIDAPSESSNNVDAKAQTAKPEPSESAFLAIDISHKNNICEQQFYFVYQELKKLETQYPAMMTFRKSVHIDRENGNNTGQNYYSLEYTNNFSGWGKKDKQSHAIDSSRPYAAIFFSLIPAEYKEGQADVSVIEGYLRDRTTKSIQNRFDSGMVIFARADADDKKLEKKIFSIFGQVIDNIRLWEKAEATRMMQQPMN
jgi:hypothetical protein